MLHYANGDKLDGIWKDDKICSQGILYCANGDNYDGEWEDDKRSGKGEDGDDSRDAALLRGGGVRRRLEARQERRQRQVFVTSRNTALLRRHRLLWRLEK